MSLDQSMEREQRETGDRLRGTEGEEETGCGQSLGGFWRDSKSGLLTLREVGEGECFERDSGTFLWFITKF